MIKIEKKDVIVVVKTATMIIAGIGCAAVVTAAIKNNVPMDSVNKYNKFMLSLGTILISSIVADAGATVAGNFVDAVLTMPLMTMEEIAKSTEEIKE